MHLAPSLVTTALTLAALTTFTSAQSVTPQSETARYPGGMSGGGNFTAAAFADFDSDGGVDAVVLDGTRVVVNYMIEAMTAPTTISTWGGVDLIAHDFAVVQEINPLGSYGTVASVGPDGLSLSMFDSVFEKFKRLQLIEGAFLDAQQVHACDWDNDGDQDIIALDATGLEILVLLGDGNGIWTAGTGFTLGLPAVDILPLDWEGSSALEVAVTDSAGLKVYEQGTGVPSYVRGNITGAGKIARIQNGGADDHLAWLVEVPNGTIYLSTLEAGSGPFNAIVFPGTDPLSIAAGDYNSDGADDLVFTLGSNDELVVLENPPSGDGRFLASAYTTLAWNKGTTFGGQDNVAPVAFADLDFDGKTDLFVASAASRELFLLYNEDKAVAIVGQPTHGFLPNQTVICENTASDGYLAIQAAFEDPSGTLDNFHVSTWLQDISTGVMDSTSHSNCSATSISGAGTYAVEVSLKGSQAPMVFTNGTQRLHILVRPQDSNGVLAAPAFHGTFTQDFNDLIASELDPSWAAYENFATIDPCSGSFTLGAGEGSQQPSKRVPPFPSNDRPVLGNTCEAPTNP